jgi:hypothetical protein
MWASKLGPDLYCHSSFWIQVAEDEDAVRDAEVMLQLFRDFGCVTERTRIASSLSTCRH